MRDSSEPKRRIHTEIVMQIAEMNGTMFGGKALYVAKAQRKEERQASF